MSAFIIAEATMNRFLDGVKAAALMSNFAAADDEYTDTKLTEIGRRFYRLNTQAVNFRYDDCNHVPKYNYSWKHPSGRKLDRVVSLKLLIDGAKAGHCLSYQCSEGRFDRTNVYRDIERKIDEIQYRFITSDPRYEEAKWD